MFSGQPAKPEAVALATEATEEDLFKFMESRAHEFIKYKVSASPWDDMQELVAGLLGFASPRIVVEVKHR